MDKNRDVDDEKMSQFSGGGVGSFENPDEYRYTAMQTIKTQGYCP